MSESVLEMLERLERDLRNSPRAQYPYTFTEDVWPHLRALLDAAKALKDAELLCQSFERNRPHIEAALQAKGLPYSWLTGWGPKIERIRAARAKLEAKHEQ